MVSNSNFSASTSYSKLLVLLTDGKPTAGIADSDLIIGRANKATFGTGISVNCISFGFNADFEFLQDLALTNFGIAKRIPVDANAAEELTGFLREITSPTIAQVQFVFPFGSVEELTAIQFPFLFSGSEIVVAGKFNDSSPETITVQVIGQGLDDTVTYESSVSMVTDTAVAGSLPSTERLWAYLEIKGLLDAKRLAEINGQNGSAFGEEALQLSLRYNFVTELTSLIVVEESSNMIINQGVGYYDYVDVLLSDWQPFPPQYTDDTTDIDTTSELSGSSKSHLIITSLVYAVSLEYF